MGIVMYISNIMIPMVILYIVGYALLKKVPIFDAFVKGAMDGLKVVFDILPTLIGLLVAIAVMRSSGCLEFLGMQIGKVTKYLLFPQELVPLVLVKMVSSSAATGLLLDIYKTYGTDSQLGVMASVLMSCSETIFYTMAVYFSAAKVKKTRYTLAGALFATFVGVVVTVWLV